MEYELPTKHAGKAKLPLIEVNWKQTQATAYSELERVVFQLAIRQVKPKSN